MINPVLDVDLYPLPKINDKGVGNRGTLYLIIWGSKFSAFNLSLAYQQLFCDEQPQS